MSHQASSNMRAFAPCLQQRKISNIKIVGVTAYDYTTARYAESAGVDFILVGDSVATVVQGKSDTLSVTIDQMCYHAEIVSRVTSVPLIVGDMPFMSYQVSIEDAIRSAGKLVQQGRVGAVKLEGGVHFAKTIEAISKIDIPVMAHIGLTPQSIHRLGGFKVQGKQVQVGRSSREAIMADALAVESSGAFAVVLEGIPQDLAQEITNKISIPTIGIGAGKYCDGQILVMHDLLGMNRFTLQDTLPKFVKEYADVSNDAQVAVKKFADEVRSGQFPTLAHTYLDEVKICAA